MTFLDSKIALGTGTLNASGIATATTSTIPGGSNSIVVSYPGDARYAAVTSGAARRLGRQGGAGGQAICLRVVYHLRRLGNSDGNPGARRGRQGVTPSGTVTFLAGAFALGSAKLNAGGTATLATGKLPAGADRVAVSYAGDTNYGALTSAALAVTVAKANLTVAAKNMSKVYGAALPALTYTLTGLVNGETAAAASKGAPSLTTTATAASKVGSYPIAVAAGTFTAANYNLKTAGGTLEVTRAVLTVTAVSASANYNQPLPNLTYSIAGLVNGDKSSVLKGYPLETTTATKGAMPGTYPITVTQGTLSPTGNYSYAFKNATLTVKPLGTVAAPTFTPGGGTYTAAQKVTLADTTPGATIYYTTNGATPTTKSAIYSAAIKVSATETIKAIATVPGYTTSTVASATYTIK